MGTQVEETQRSMERSRDWSYSFSVCGNEDSTGEGTDLVNHPPHYTKGKIEVIEFIEDQQLDYVEGNIIKYVCRYKYKNGLEDLKKAMWYLQRRIDDLDQCKESAS